MANRSYSGAKMASPDAVKRLMEGTKGLSKDIISDPTSYLRTRKGAVKLGGSPISGMPTVGRGKPAPVLSGKKRKNLKDNLGLKNAAARRLSKIGQSKFSGRAV